MLSWVMRHEVMNYKKRLPFGENGLNFLFMTHDFMTA